MENKNVKKKVLATVLGLSIAATGALVTGYHINKIAKKNLFYTQGVSEYNNYLTSEELLNEFNNVYNNSQDMQEYWGCIYPEITEFLQEYGECINQTHIIETLPELKFTLVDRNELDNHVMAMYSLDDNEITINEKLLSKSEKEKKEILLHETLHYFLCGHFSYSNKKAYALDEGSVSLLTREFDAYAGIDAYEKNAYYVRVLCELIGPDKYISALCHNDYNELEGYLEEYASSKDVSNLIDNINKACKYTIYNTEYDQASFEIINEIYQNKNGITIEESNDNVMKIYSNKIVETSYEIEAARFPYHAKLNKNYFINIDTPYISLIRTGQYYGTVYLNENNEVESGSVLQEGYYDEDGNVVDNKGNIIEEELINYGPTLTK